MQDNEQEKQRHVAKLAVRQRLVMIIYLVVGLFPFGLVVLANMKITTLFGISILQWAKAIPFLIVGGAIAYAVIWRCPACGQWLPSRSGILRFCSHCGVQLMP